MTEKEILHILQTTKDPYIETKMINRWPVETIPFDCLELAGLKQLSTTAAKALAQRVKAYGKDDDGEYQTRLSLIMNDLEEITDDAARELAKCAPPLLCLMGLKSISDVAARALASTKCNGLQLTGLVEISEKAIATLAKSKIEGYIDLNIPAGISAKTIEQFSHCQQEKLLLQFAGEVSIEITKALSEVTSNLGLKMKELSIEGAKGLSGYTGDILTLTTTKPLADEALKILRDGRGGYTPPKDFYYYHEPS